MAVKYSDHHDAITDTCAIVSSLQPRLSLAIAQMAEALQHCSVEVTGCCYVSFKCLSFQVALAPWTD